MMQPLIFTEQRLAPRVFDVLLTVIAWAAFTYLIYFDLMKELMLPATTGPRPFYATLGTIAIYVLMALLNGVALLIWAKYNQFRFRVERRKRRPDLEHEEVAESFQITPKLVTEMNKGRVQTVFHDDHGGIDHVEVNRAIGENLLPAPTEPGRLPLLPAGETVPASLAAENRPH
ncbi:poly-beta-1,6-N-acetyl-D-glucosamine biosynthesis protein PgaD [Franconibacter pulveris]|uniref:Hemin storage protein n=1 Tax=Franconibacter pulveris TaxID=435910 RepID=A0A0J8VH34_9ENTR|nr:poly-beta-1,6-N-acetyl-D-glucosamine biosynthesis protein PgaD [Franconibacter pulveris]KMV32551.1 hemin storage protein [Franconibacter pulveris]